MQQIFILQFIYEDDIPDDIEVFANEDAVKKYISENYKCSEKVNFGHVTSATKKFNIDDSEIEEGQTAHAGTLEYYYTFVRE